MQPLQNLKNVFVGTFNAIYVYVNIWVTINADRSEGYMLIGVMGVC